MGTIGARPLPAPLATPLTKTGKPTSCTNTEGLCCVIISARNCNSFKRYPGLSIYICVSTFETKEGQKDKLDGLAGANQGEQSVPM